MHENIKSKLAIQIAQLSLDKATVEAQLEESQQTITSLQAQVAELTKQLDEATKPEGVSE
ncbi:hypothetical protein [Streptococcus suis]|uniref:hypothetical protein n=1 Tax=Streptococcus suis TaxID=1307 RepID=UPI00211D5CE4|nr:hypothetical protein [Streptococcus suis]UUM58626.1 hypothetical protein NQZ91_04465 [Streptococcus suis]